MNRKIFLTTTLTIVLVMVASGVNADCHKNCTTGCNTGCTAGCGGCVTCPRCSACCELKVEKGKESKSCFKVECKEICIPRIVLPWQSRCNPCASNGARVRTVRVFSSHSYECPACEYSWSVKEGCCNGCGGGCTGGCSESCTETDADVTDEDATTVTSRFTEMTVDQQASSTPVQPKSVNRLVDDAKITLAPAPRKRVSFTGQSDNERVISVVTSPKTLTTIPPKPRLGRLFK